ncbi:MAG: PAS domain-containing protein [Bacteroidales bacterium]
MKDTHTKSASETLREKAEDLLKKKPVSHSTHQLLNSLDAETLKLIHELEVHQFELELQNEDLLKSRYAAHAAAEKYTALYDLAPSGYFTLSTDGTILELNPSGATMLGKNRPNLKASRFGFFISDDTRPVFNLFLDKVFSNKSKETCEVTFLTKSNLLIYVHLTGIVIENGEKCIVTLVDLTGSMLMDAMRANEKVLLSSENRLQKEVELRTRELVNLNKNIKIELNYISLN